MSGLDTYVKLLLHGNGANGATSIADASASAHAQTAHGACSLSTAIVKFGTAALKFSASTLDWLEVSNSADFDFNNGDFTIDYWVYQTSAATPVVHVARTRAPTWPPFLIGYGGTDIYMSSNGTAWDIASGKTIGAVALNAWSHIEVSRKGNAFYAFRDGVLQDTWSSSLAFPACSGALAIGSGQAGDYMNGYIDELRVSKGICRHSANFTPETAEYSAAAPTHVPPSATAFGLVVDSAIVTSPLDYLDLIDTNPAPCRNYLLEYYNVVSDREIPPISLPDALLTVYLSTDQGASFFMGANYNNTGIDAFAGESNALYAAPFSFGTPQALTYGMRLSVDTGDLPAYGVTGEARFKNAGGHTQCLVHGVKGAMGGLASDIRPAGTKPASQVGGKWFPADGSQYFHWAIPFIYGGHFDGANGVAPNAFRLKMDGGGTSGIKIASGTFILRRMD